MDLGYAKRKNMKRIISWHWYVPPPQQGAPAEFTGVLTGLWAYAVSNHIFSIRNLILTPFLSSTHHPRPPPAPPLPSKNYRMEPGEGCKGKISH